jgi:MSHA biogenesis protein MshI
MFLKTKVENKPGQVGLNISSEGISVAYIDKSGVGLPILQYCRFFRTQKQSENKDKLQQWVNEHQLLGTNTVCVLSPQQYELFLIEEPNTPEKDLLASVRWKMKDYLSYPVEGAIVDYLPLPGKTEDIKGGVGYAVVAKKITIDEVVQITKQAGLVVVSVDIAELALRNIATLFKENLEGVLFIRLSSVGSQILVFKKSTVHLMRQVDINTRFLFEADANNDTLKQKLISELVVEIQRSLEYCVSNLKQSGIRHIVLAPTNEKNEVVKEELKNEFGINVHVMTLKDFVQYKDAFDLLEQNKCLFAIGGALR